MCDESRWERVYQSGIQDPTRYYFDLALRRGERIAVLERANAHLQQANARLREPAFDELVKLRHENAELRHEHNKLRRAMGWHARRMIQQTGG